MTDDAGWGTLVCARCARPKRWLKSHVCVACGGRAGAAATAAAYRIPSLRTIEAALTAFACRYPVGKTPLQRLGVVPAP